MKAQQKRKEIKIFHKKINIKANELANNRYWINYALKTIIKN